MRPRTAGTTISWFDAPGTEMLPQPAARWRRRSQHPAVSRSGSTDAAGAQRPASVLTPLCVCTGCPMPGTVVVSSARGARGPRLLCNRHLEQLTCELGKGRFHQAVDTCTFWWAQRRRLHGH